MRLGLLELDHVSEEYRHLDGDYRDMFARLLAGLELRAYDACEGELPDSPEDCDAWLATGSRRSVYDELAWIGPAAGFVRDVHEAGVPYVGICFGHQLLAWALGGNVERAHYGWGCGVRTLEIIHKEPWMDPPVTHLRLHHMHQDQVTALPDDGVVLACADHCEIAMFRVGTTMLGLQAHPEFTAAYAEALIEKRVDLIGVERAEEAIESLIEPTDDGIVAAWLAKFVAADPA